MTSTKVYRRFGEMIPTVIFGSEGISRETLTIIDDINEKMPTYDFLGFVEDEETKIGMNNLGYKVICSDNLFEDFCSNYEKVAVIIPQGNPKIKVKIYSKIQHIRNVFFPNIIHPDVKVRESIKLGIGNIITSGVKMTCDIHIGNFNLLNLNVTVGHDTVIKDFNVINPLVSISGGVQIGNRNLIGTGVNILQYLQIGDDVTIGAGACLTKDAKDSGVYVGIPARKIGGN